MTEFRWELTTRPSIADEAGHQGVVTMIPWRLVAIGADGAEASVSGCFTPPMPEAGAQFTALRDLSLAQVVAWLEAQPMVESYRAEAAARLARPELAEPKHELPAWMEGLGE